LELLQVEAGGKLRVFHVQNLDGAAADLNRVEALPTVSLTLSWVTTPAETLFLGCRFESGCSDRYLYLPAQATIRDSHRPVGRYSLDLVIRVVVIVTWAPADAPVASVTVPTMSPEMFDWRRQPGCGIRTKPATASRLNTRPHSATGKFASNSSKELVAAGRLLRSFSIRVLRFGVSVWG